MITPVEPSYQIGIKPAANGFVVYFRKGEEKSLNESKADAYVFKTLLEVADALPRLLKGEKLNEESNRTGKG